MQKEEITTSNVAASSEDSSLKGVFRTDLELYLNTLLDVARYKDYAPNGLQVEGVAQVRHIVTGVTASMALIDAAIERGADTLLVHHGYFWRGEDARVIGMKQRRLKKLLAHNINLLAYHLPLDGHAELGNNAQLARQLGLRATGRFGEADIGWVGECAPTTASGLQAFVSQQLGRSALLVGDANRSIQRVGWCTGGAQGYFEDAIAQGVDVFISGEISEQTTHLARESGVVYIAAGHHATERFGVQALGRHVMTKFDVYCEFVDIDNPV